jgi:hypothetical protein
MLRALPSANNRCFPLFVLAAALAFLTNAFAVGEPHYAGASARLTGRLSIEKRTSEDVGEAFAILRLENPVSLLHRSQYPGDAPQTEETEILLLGGFTFEDFASCQVAATGTLDFRRIGPASLPKVQMQLQRIECRETGLSSGTITPDPPSANVRLDPYGCEPSSLSSVWVTRRWSPYSDMDQEMWKAADLLMRDDVVARWPFDELRSLALRLVDARARLTAAFPDVHGEWEMEYVPRVVELELGADLQSRLDAVEVEDDRIRRLPIPIDSGLEKVCEAVCGCTVILERNSNGRVSIGFSPTTNLLYAIRRLREIPEVRSARLIRAAPSTDRTSPVRNVLRVRKLPSAFHITLETTAVLPGARRKRFFVVDDSTAREVGVDEVRTLLSFDPPSLPSGVWQ